MRVKMRRFDGKLTVAALAASFLAASLFAASPALAQSAGYKFLEAIKKNDEAVIVEMINKTGLKGTPGDIIINTRDISTGDTPLHVLIQKRNLKWISALIARGADMNVRNVKGVTPLWLAINNGYSDAALLLVSNGARPNDPGPAGETPLIASVHQKNLELVRALIKAKADPGRADSSGRTALDYARLSDKSSQIVTELEAAIKAAKASKAKSYGPSL